MTPAARPAMPETEPVNVYRVVLMVPDFDRVGRQEIIDTIENVKYPNRCISPSVFEADVREVPWHDGHPLNKTGEWRPAFARLFDDED